MKATGDRNSERRGETAGALPTTARGAPRTKTREAPPKGTPGVLPKSMLEGPPNSTPGVRPKSMPEALAKSTPGVRPQSTPEAVPKTMRPALPKTMRAVVLTEPHRHEVRADVPVPRPGPLEVLCEVDSVAICGTDVHIYEGRFPGRWPKSYPFIPGHEWSGTVVEVGPAAGELGWRVGQRVAGTSHAGCGYCRMCRTGRYNLCENYGREPLHHQYGHYSQGADAEYVVHSIKSVFPLPDELELAYGAMVDTASIALHSVKRPGINPGDVVVVVGAGPMGILTADCARALGAGTVIVTGSGERLARAHELGFPVVNYREEDPVAAVRHLTGGKGANVAIDTGGTVHSIRQAVDVLAKGGRVAFTGVPTEGDAALPLQKIVLEEIDLFGVRANRNTMEEVIPLIVSERVRVKPLVTHTFALEDYGEALHTFAERVDGALKVLVQPGRAPARAGR